jgi:hypothetical protein
MIRARALLSMGRISQARAMLPAIHEASHGYDAKAWSLMSISALEAEIEKAEKARGTRR